MFGVQYYAIPLHLSTCPITLHHLPLASSAPIDLHLFRGSGSRLFALRGVPLCLFLPVPCTLCCCLFYAAAFRCYLEGAGGRMGAQQVSERHAYMLNVRAAACGIGMQPGSRRCHRDVRAMDAVEGGAFLIY